MKWKRRQNRLRLALTPGPAVVLPAWALIYINPHYLKAGGPLPGVMPAAVF
jgi:hypothetical protein